MNHVVLSKKPHCQLVYENWNLRKIQNHQSSSFKSPNHEPSSCESVDRRYKKMRIQKLVGYEGLYPSTGCVFSGKGKIEAFNLILYNGSF